MRPCLVCKRLPRDRRKRAATTTLKSGRAVELCPECANNPFMLERAETLAAEVG
jgi:hypothetical protein